MTPDTPNILDREVLVYVGCDSRRRAWLSVLLAAGLTACMFVMLPFTEILRAPAADTVALRTVTTTRAVPPQRELPRFRRPAASARDPEVSAPREKPKLEEPKHAPQPAAALPVTLDLPAPEFRPDFAIGALTPFAAVRGSVSGTGLTPQYALDMDTTFAVTAEPDVAPVEPEQPEPDPAPAIFAVNQLDRAPRPTLQLAPVYPYRAKARNIEGFVELAFVLSTEGKVTEVRVVDAEPGELFVQAARRAVQRWRFEPGIRDGQPVPVQVQVKLRFELK